MDASPNSEATAVIKQLHNLVMRKHRGRQTVAWLIQNEEDYLQTQRFYFNEVPKTSSDHDRKTGSTEVRKSFSDLKSKKSKTKRVESIIKNIEEDDGLEKMFLKP